MNKTVKTLAGLLCAAILMIVLLWGSGLIPKGIGKHTAMKYVQQNYREMDLRFAAIEFSSAYGDYIAQFVDAEGAVYNFRLFSGHLPCSVVYDSIRQGEAF